ncbi:MAG: helix-turn-helix transcriptional regulator [Rikenellaceae bacterium]|nr:helix-turn-helix transcriptional regulator [Rikenellaceae bacterium]
MAADKSDVEYLRLMKGDVLVRDMAKAGILLLVKGRMSVTYEKADEQTLGDRQMIVMPLGVGRMTLRAQRDCGIVLVRTDSLSHLCGYNSMESLSGVMDKHRPKQRLEVIPLDFNQRIVQYINSLAPVIEDEVYCKEFMDLKARELLFILRTFYTKDELAGFFQPLVSNDMSFSNFVWTNYRKVKGVSDFADLYNCSVSTFKQKFKDVFGMPALKWMNEQRARNIYYDLRYSEKTLTQISEEYHFASVSYLSTFCKNNLSQTTREIRSRKIKKSILPQIPTDF